MEEPNTINNSPGSGIKFYDQRDGRICRRSLTGNYNKLSMTHSNSTNAVTGEPYALRRPRHRHRGQQQSRNSAAAFGKRDAVMLNGKSNRVDFVADNVTGGSALNRIGGATNDKRGNVVTGTVSNASTGFTSSNSPLLERIVLTMDLLARRPGKGMPLVPGRSRCE